jgi:hypothetical protein
MIHVLNFIKFSKLRFNFRFLILNIGMFRKVCKGFLSANSIAFALLGMMLIDGELQIMSFFFEKDVVHRLLTYKEIAFKRWISQKETRLTADSWLLLITFLKTTFGSLENGTKKAAKPLFKIQMGWLRHSFFAHLCF